MLFATIRSLIPQPRQPEQPRRYVGRHREPELALPERELVTVPDLREAEPDAA
jgi:hypothetical protein